MLTPRIRYGRSPQFPQWLSRLRSSPRVFLRDTDIESVSQTITLGDQRQIRGGPLATLRYRHAIESFASSQDGDIFMANGIDPMLRWSGFGSEAIPAGLDTPTAKPTIAATASSSNLGIPDSTDIITFQDFTQSGNPFVTRSVPVPLVNGSSKITYPGAQRPVSWFDNTSGSGCYLYIDSLNLLIRVVSQNSITDTRLAPADRGAYLLSAPFSGATGSYTFKLYRFVPAALVILGTYRVYQRFIDSRGEASALSPISDESIVVGATSLTYSNLGSVTDPRVKRRQILRNTDGQFETFYVDVDTEDLTSATLTSIKTDSQLSAGTAFPLLDGQGRDLTTRDTAPASTFAFIAHHLDRLFGAGITPYEEGSIILQAGSKTVSGVGTDWPTTLAGRQLWTPNGDKAYEIASVDQTNQTLTLAEAYAGPTEPYASYAIRPFRAYARLVQFSAAGRPEGWSPLNAVGLPEDNDRVTALVPRTSFLYIFEERHCYRLTFGENPLTDGALFLNMNRGCVNHRCWIESDQEIYAMDEQGIYLVSNREVQQISDPIQDLFLPGQGPWRINWQASRWFHASSDPGRQILRWFVALAGQDFPRHALCWSETLQRWWIEEYPLPITSSETMIIDDRPHVLLGGLGKIYTLEPGTLELADPGAGTVTGTITARGRLWIEDSQASFSPLLVGTTICLLTGRGVRQWRRIDAVSGTRLYLDRPWRIRPSVRDGYQLGAIRWSYRTGLFWWVPSDVESPRRLEVRFTPTPGQFLLQCYQDRSVSPVVWDYTSASADAMGMASTRGSADLVGDLSKESGFLQRRMDGQKDMYLDGLRQFAVRLDGCQPARFSGVRIDGAIGVNE